MVARLAVLRRLIGGRPAPCVLCPGLRSRECVPYRAHRPPSCLGGGGWPGLSLLAQELPPAPAVCSVVGPPS